MKGRAELLLFYAALGAGCWLFAGPGAAAVLVLLVAAGNRASLLAGHALRMDGPPGFSLSVRSLLVLGVLPFVWLVCRSLAGEAALPVLCVLVAAGAVLAPRRRPPIEAAPHPPACGGIVLAFVLVVAATYIPFSRIGAPIDGSCAYRAYFSSDYLKHFSVVEALEAGPIPPRNPYFAGEPLHYYWLPYAVPAVISRIAGSTPKAMFAYSFAVNFLFLLLLFHACRRISGRRRRLAFLAVPLVLVPSLEGLYFWAARARFSFAAFFDQGRAINIDGLTRWLWNLPQIDTLLRALLYTPQHLLSLAFVLLFLILADEERENPWLLSLALALSLAASFFVGGVLLLSWGLYVLGREGARLVRGNLRLGAFILGMVRRFALPAGVIALTLGLKMVVRSGGGIAIRPLGPRDALILLGLNLGALGVGGVAGLLAARFRTKAFLIVLLAVSLALVLAIRIPGFESDVSLKAGLVLILALALLVCRLAESPVGGRVVLPLTLLVLIAGAPTAVLDVRNSSDVRNARFTSYVPADEMKVLEWIGRHAPRGRTVQTFPPAREWNLSVVPSFAGRPMAVGDRMHGQIFQVRPEAYAARIDALRSAIAGLPATRSDLRRLGVDYLLWSEPERRSFGRDPEGLAIVRRLGQTVLYAVGEE